MKTSKKNSKQRSRKFKKNAKRLAAYSAAAAATVMTTGDRTANAMDVVWDIVDITVTNTGSYLGGRGVFFNMTNGATSSRFYAEVGNYNNYYDFQQGKFALDPFAGGYIYGPAYTYADLGPLAFIGNIQQVGTAPAYYVVYADPLPGGSSLVSAGDNFNTPPSSYYSNFYAYLNFSNGQTGFVGIRFELPAGGQNVDTHFGWAQITREDSRNFTLHGFGYNDTPDAASHPEDTAELFGDLDRDGDIDLIDWAALRDNYGADLSGEIPPVFGAYEKGDVTHDGLNDIRDFDLFREAYEAENGVGSFAAMVAASAVPEPSSILLLAAGAAGLGMWRKKRSG